MNQKFLEHTNFEFQVSRRHLSGHLGLVAPSDTSLMPCLCVVAEECGQGEKYSGFGIRLLIK